MIPKFKGDFSGVPDNASVGVSTASRFDDNKKRSTSSILATIIFILAILSIVGAYGLKFYYQNQYDAYVGAIEDIKNEFDETVILEVIEFHNLVENLRDIDNRRVPLHNFFVKLEELALPQVKLGTFGFKAINDGEYSISFAASAPNLGVISRQIELFEADDLFKTFSFGDVSYINDSFESAYSFSARGLFNRQEFVVGLRDVANNRPVVSQPAQVSPLPVQNQQPNTINTQPVTQPVTLPVTQPVESSTTDTTDNVLDDFFGTQDNDVGNNNN